MISKKRHELFDKLSGTAPHSRKRTDLIDREIWERSKCRLRSVEIGKIVVLSHKFFAHAADSNSLGILSYDGILLSDIEKAQREIVRVERFITDDILLMGVARDVVAMEPLGFLSMLDGPYVAPETIAKMRAHWDELTTERNSWANGYRDDLYRTA